VISEFYNRDDEQKRLKRFLSAKKGGLAVVFGRRRCGKSTLLQRVLSKHQVYFQADQRETPLQLAALAGVIARELPDFDRAVYRTWDELLSSLYARVADHHLAICLDEFPYLAQGDPALPSVLQRYLDRQDRCVDWILCGSSQRMMHGLVLERSAPLYGRAREILEIKPLSAGWLMSALRTDATEAIKAYALWGGVPRYWELASDYHDQGAAIEDLVWNRSGVLHEEPTRLLLDDLRSAVQPYSILSLIGSGCHRPSELSSSLGKPLSSLARPLAQLCKLGYVRRDIPFGEKPKKTRRALYRLSDPFLRFFFKFVLPHQSALAQGLMHEAIQSWQRHGDHHYATCWEDLCRSAVPWLRERLPLCGPASAWWHDTEGHAEVDIVAPSFDKKSILLGECKWSNRKKAFHLTAIDEELRRKATLIPGAKGKKVITSCWLGGAASTTGEIDILFTPEDVMMALKR
jgi:AAA+ ATPase superfamily predicted ATPase